MDGFIDRAIATMRSPKDMHIICVDVTNRCDLRCSNCTRLLVNQTHHWDMSPDNFRAALRSLRDYPGVIAMIGGNPCLHKEFPALCRIFVEEIPVKRQRGLWSNNVFNHQELIRDTFGFFNLNPHNDPKGMASLAKLRELIPGLAYYQGNSHHAPLLTAVQDIIPDPEKMWDAITRCDINRNWSASIVENKGELRAYFCEVAAAFDLARGGDHGAPVEPGWWRRSVTDFADQVKRFCPGCGVPARLKGHLDADETDDYSPTNADIATRTRGRRTVAHVTSAEETTSLGHAVTDYTEQHLRPNQPPPAPMPMVQARPARVSVVIPCYNAAATIEETLDSVLAQRVHGKVEVEIIVADDLSTDDSAAVVARVADRHPGVIRFLPTAVNAGPAAARNRGLKHATGDLVCFLDADDCYAPRFFETAAAAFAHYANLAVIMTGIELVDSHRTVHPAQLAQMTNSLPSNVILRRAVAEIVGGFPEHPAFRGKNAGEDIAFKQALFGHFVHVFLDHPFLRYRVRKGGHFDWYLDATQVVDGVVRHHTLPAEELDGSRPAAVAAYLQGIASRLAAIDTYRQPRPFQSGGLELIAEYEALKARLSGPGDTLAADGYVLYRCAATGGGTGHVGVSERLPMGLRPWLEAGCALMKRLPVVPLSAGGPLVAMPPLRLLVIDARGNQQEWLAELQRGLATLAPGGCAVIYGWEGAEKMRLFQAMLSLGISWRELGAAGRVIGFERLPPQRG